MYTYLIGWSAHNRYYYGCRYSKRADPKQLWTTYFTSSKAVKQMRQVYGEPDVVQVRKTFASKHECLVWEHKVLRRLKAATSTKWLNLTNGSLFANTKHKIVVKDAKTGITVGAVDEDHPLYVSGEYVFHLTGIQRGPSQLRGRPRPAFKDTLLAVDPITEQCFKVKKDDDRLNTKELVPWLSLFCHAKNANGEVVSVKRDDPRLKTGELVSTSRGMVPVKDPQNSSVRFTVDKNDPRLQTGELVHARKGVRSKNPHKAARLKEQNGRWSGVSDDQYFKQLVELVQQTGNTMRWKQLAVAVGLPASRYHLRSQLEKMFALPTYR